MSNRIQITIQKVLASVTMSATVLGLAGFSALTPVTALAVAPADYGLHEGDTISATGSNDPDIYIVNDWGYKRLFLNPAIFTLYGHLSWAGVKSVSPATRDAFGTSGLFRNCEVAGDQKVWGLEVTGEDTANLRWVNTTGAQAVMDDPNFFKKVFCINTAEQNLYGVGADYTSVLQVPAYTRGGQVTPPPSGSISASLSSDNPAANTIISGQAAADLAHFTFSGNGTVTSVVLNRVGVSSDTVLSNVYLYMGSKRLTDAAAVSQGKITFSDTAGLFAVNGSANISVKADILTGISGQTVGVQLVTFNGISTSLSGNLFNIASTPTDFGTVSVGAPTPSSTTTLDPQNDYNAWQSVISVGNHDAWLKALQLRVIGSVLPGDLRNFRLFVDGIQVGTAVAQTDSNGYIVFDLSSNPTLLKTGSRTLKLLVDVIGGSNRNFTVSLRQKPDLYVVESQYMQPELVSGTFPASSGEQDINQGTLTITKAATSPSGDIVKDTSGAVVSRFTFEAHGESVKVENLIARLITSSGVGFLKNGAIYVDGAQVGSIQNITSTSAGTQFNLGSSLVVVPGTPRTVEIRADIAGATSTNTFANGNTFSASLLAGSSNVQRLTSLNYMSSSATTANTLTVRTGSFTAAKYSGYANQSVVAPRAQFKVGHYTLTAASSEGVNVNTITVDVPLTGGGASLSVGDLTNMFIKVWNDSGTLIYTSSPKSTVSNTASNSYSVNITIPMSKTYQVEVYGDLQSTFDSNDALVTNLDATGVSASSNTSVSASQATGQLISGATGSLSLNNGSIAADTLQRGGQNVTAYSFTLQPTFDDFTLDDATFRLEGVTASDQGAVGTLSLYDNSSGTPVLVASTPMTTTASSAFAMTGMNFPMTQLGGTKTFTVVVSLNNVGVGANDTGGKVRVQLTHLKYHDSNGNVTNSSLTPATYQGNLNVVHKSYPSFANVALPTTTLTAGEQTLFKTAVTANGAAVGLNRLVFSITVPASSHTVSSFKIFEDGVDISSLGVISSAAGSYDIVHVTTGGTAIVAFTFTNERTISSGGSKTYELRGTNSSNTGAVVTKIAQPSSTVQTDDAVTVHGTLSSTSPSVTWSDQSAVGHNMTTTDDWMNDYLIKTINVSQTLTP